MLSSAPHRSLCKPPKSLILKVRQSHLLLRSAATVRSPMIGSIINAEVAPSNGTQRVSTFRLPQLCTPFFEKLLVALRPVFVVLVAAGWMSISAATPSISARGQDSASAAQQAPAPIPEFEVATIRPNKASDGMRLMTHTPSGLSVKNVPAICVVFISHADSEVHQRNSRTRCHLWGSYKDEGKLGSSSTLREGVIPSACKLCP
jgi:hypothetical protein